MQLVGNFVSNKSELKQGALSRVSSFITRGRNYFLYKKLPFDIWFDIQKTYFYLLFLTAYLRRFAKKKIVVISLIDYIGDIVTCEPVIREVRRNNSDAYILWIVKKGFKELLIYHPDLNKVSPVKCLKTWKFIKKKIRFDEVIDLHIHHKYDELSKEFLDKENPPEVTFQNYVSYGSLLNAFCKSAGIAPVKDNCPRLYIPSKAHRSLIGKIPPKPFITFHRTSKDISRDWDDSKWVPLIFKINRDINYPIIEIGNKNQGLNIISEKYFNLCGRLSLLQTAQVIKESSLFIGINSGPAHMANAVGTFGVVLLGRYGSFTDYMPFCGDYETGINAIIIRAVNGNVKDIAVDEVYNSVWSRLEDSGRLIIDS